jgi:hypothetical protein
MIAKLEQLSFSFFTISWIEDVFLCLPSKRDALTSNPSTITKKKKKLKKKDVYLHMS